MARRPSILLTFFLFFAVAAGAQFDTPFDQDSGGGSGGGGSCSVCRMAQSGDSITMTCASPAPGGWGYQNCRIEAYPEGSFCFVDGNQCCVD